MVGIIQEQHPDRARLFMQWKQMGWPILVDAYNLLEIPVVPVTLALDERGVIRSVLAAPPEGELGEDFLVETFGEGVTEPENAPPAAGPNMSALYERARSHQTPAAWKAYADAIAVWGGEGRLDQAIEAYGRVVELNPRDNNAHFRLGVAYRARYDGPTPRPGDFQQAVDHWSVALDLDPNQYIWRRRIQQYGPRLDKPYPFYDWVAQARDEIRARGEEPSPLVVEPRGSEFAAPAQEFVTSVDSGAEPDPGGRVLRDEGEFINVEVIVVPPRVAPGAATRVHFVFQPRVETKAHWNNEAGETVVWINPPPGWVVERQLRTHPIPPEVATQETRTVEVELLAPAEPRGRSATLSGYALYYVCEDVNGICMYRRRDLSAELQVRR
ncbi:MAG: tetratricopeptide repeat protein [Gemmatimonadetes bacterium]|nr:tetratricopeptide repeat protein [Gemmatimonadota bacterium]